MKKFISGLLIGIFISISLTAFAAGLKIIPNPYPVLFNGEKVDVSGYNINGSTYLKLSDFANFGLGVKYNSLDKTIYLDSIQFQATISSEGGNSMNSDKTNDNVIITKDGREIEIGSPEFLEETKVIDIAK